MYFFSQEYLRQSTDFAFASRFHRYTKCNHDVGICKYETFFWTDMTKAKISKSKSLIWIFSNFYNKNFNIYKYDLQLGKNSKFPGLSLVLASVRTNTNVDGAMS